MASAATGIARHRPIVLALRRIVLALRPIVLALRPIALVPRRIVPALRRTLGRTALRLVGPAMEADREALRRVRVARAIPGASAGAAVPAEIPVEAIAEVTVGVTADAIDPGMATGQRKTLCPRQLSTGQFTQCVGCHRWRAVVIQRDHGKFGRPVERLPRPRQSTRDRIRCFPASSLQPRP